MNKIFKSLTMLAVVALFVVACGATPSTDARNSVGVNELKEVVATSQPISISV